MSRQIALPHCVLSAVLLGLGGGPAAAAVMISGPSQIVSATTTATLVNNAGGALTPHPALVDNIKTGAAGTFVEFPAAELPSVSFTFQFDQAYNINEFKLWNDRGARDSGIDAFQLHFFDSSQALIGSTGVLNASSTFQGSNPTPEVFSLGSPYYGATSATLEIHSALTSSFVQFREVAFCGEVPEPSAATAALLGLGSVAGIGMRRRLG